MEKGGKRAERLLISHESHNRLKSAEKKKKKERAEGNGYLLLKEEEEEGESLKRMGEEEKETKWVSLPFFLG